MKTNKTAPAPAPQLPTIEQDKIMRLNSLSTDNDCDTSISDDEETPIIKDGPSTFERQRNISMAYHRNSIPRKMPIGYKRSELRSSNGCIAEYPNDRSSWVNDRTSFLNEIADEQAQAEVLSKMQQMEQSGSTVMSTLTKAFGNRDASNFWVKKPKDVKQILREAEADQAYKRLKRNSRIIIQIKSKAPVILPRIIIHPEKEWRCYWDVFMLFLVCYYAIITPVNIAFDKSPFDVVALEILFNLCFVVDIVLQFFTSYKHTDGPQAGRLETSHSAIIWNYLKGWFWIDVLASFPIDLIMQAATGQRGGNVNRLLRLVRSVKLMRILRMSRIWKRLLTKARLNPSIVRLAKLFGFLLIEWHWIGCTYWAIAVSQGFSEEMDADSWTPWESVSDCTFGSQYVRAYFWAVMVTTGVGKDIIPNSDTQFIFTTMAIIIGVLMYALIVGSVGSALQSIDTPDSQRRRRMDAVREYLRQRDISEELTEQVLNYYDYCYTRHISQHDEVILEDIHSALKEKLDLEMNQQLLQKVPRFKQLPEALLLILIHSLISRIYLPNELVYMIGERAAEMFFVARGDLEELNSKGQTNRYLSDGSSFGDQLFEESACRREATVRCITHCELLILTKDSLKKIMRLFPEFAMMVQKWSGIDKYGKLTPWERIQYALRTAKMMKIMGQRNVRFQDVMRHLNGVDNKGVGYCDGNVHRKSAAKEMDYGDFKDNFAHCFTKVHEDMLKAKKKKERMKKLKKKKRMQEKKGGKVSIMLGCEPIPETARKTIIGKL